MTSDRIRPAIDGLFDAQVENHAQERLLFNPDAEVNSIIEMVLELRHLGVPQDRLRLILVALREVLISNGRERDGERLATGVLDDLLREMHNTGMRSQIRVRELAVALRPLLREILSPRDDLAKLTAQREITRLTDTYGVAKLLCAGMRGQLGGDQWRVLNDLIGGAVK